MAEKEPQFTVSDRRKFTLEGERRDGEETGENTYSSEAATASRAAAAPPVEAAQPPADFGPTAPEEKPGGKSDEVPQPTAAESAQQKQDYHASSRQLDDMVREANPGAQGNVAMSFDRLVQSIYMTAAMQLGAGTEPNEQPRIDIMGARQSIDMLGVLEEKTKGNLTEEEKRLLQSALFDLRMSFLDITNAIAKQAQQRPAKPGVTR
jgi:Domain of unknown function (DUF1844)